MVQLILPNEILNDTPADATPVEQNYQYIQSHINQQMINRDGSVAMAGQLHLVGDPVNVLDAATKGYVDAILPIGVMLPFCAPVAPAGQWALCNGASLNTATYPKLYSVLGTRFGTGGTGTFLLPDMRGRLPIGVDAAQTAFDLVGETGGTWTVPVAPHGHPMAHDHGTFNSSDNLSNHLHAINPPSTVTGGAGAHNHDFSYIVDQDTGQAGGGARPVGYVGTGLHTVTGTEPVHTHTVDIAQFNSGANSGNHTHSVNVPPYAGGAATSVAGAVGNTGNNTKTMTSTADISTTHIPPYVVVTYIIRVD